MPSDELIMENPCKEIQGEDDDIFISDLNFQVWSWDQRAEDTYPVLCSCFNIHVYREFWRPMDGIWWSSPFCIQKVFYSSQRFIMGAERGTSIIDHMPCGLWLLKYQILTLIIS